MPITEEMLQKVRGRAGQWFAARPWSKIASEDAIRHFARGVGDNNPLWNDPEYARKTRWGGVIAPPTYGYTGRRGGGLTVGLPGIAGVWAGDTWEWFQPIKAGDSIVCYQCHRDLVERPSRIAGRAFDQTTETALVNQRDEVVARYLTLSKRYDRSGTKSGAGKSKYEGWTPHKYTPEELKAIDDGYEREVIRGATPRYWEEVEVGEEFIPVLKGPYVITEVIAWYAGAGAPLGLASRIRWEYFQRHPGAKIPDPETNIPDVPERIHWDRWMGRSFGAPDYFDVGIQRLSWLAHVVTNWMGDDGFLRKLHGETREFNMHGDTHWIKAKVTKKYIEGDEYLVECDIWADNQRRETTALGNAKVSLPSKVHGPVVLPKASTKSEYGIEKAAVLR